MRAATALLFVVFACPVALAAPARVVETQLACGPTQRVFVLVPELTTRTPDVLVYYHGLDGYYDGKGIEDALRSTDGLLDAVGARNDLIAILPEALPGEADKRAAVQRCVNQPGGFARLVSVGLAAAKVDGVRQIGLAAHSGGGAMIGPSVAPEGGDLANKISEITLLDAGYAYRRSWEQARAWLLADPDRPKVVRVFTGGDDNASYAVKYFARRGGPRSDPLGQALEASGTVLTDEALASFDLAGVTLDVIELVRGQRNDAVVLRMGSAEARGRKTHYPIRDGGLRGTVRETGRNTWRVDEAQPARQ